MSNTYKGFTNNLGKRIVELRKKRKITQEELANSASVERSYMGGIERGEKNPTIKKIFNIAKALKVRVSKLFD